jgi:hypothetical protein
MVRMARLAVLLAAVWAVIHCEWIESTAGGPIVSVRRGWGHDRMDPPACAACR